MTTGAWTAVDDRRVVPALGGLIEGTGMWRTGTLACMDRTGRFLTGAWDPPGPEGEDGPGIAGEGSWVRFIGRIGAVALRAAVASTRPERRERQLALLEMWAESPFADPAARLRTGIVVTERLAVRDEHGAAVSVGWSREGRRRFVELRTGDAEPPSLGEIEEARDVPRGWGSPEQLRRLVALVRERGPAPWDREAVALLRERTGMGRPAASLALAGLLERMYVPFLDADERATLRLKVAEAEDGASELARLTAPERLELLADVLPEDPAELWEPDGMRGVAERLAEAWQTRCGRRVVVPERTLKAVVELQLLRLSAAEFCAAFTHPPPNPGSARPSTPGSRTASTARCSPTPGGTSCGSRTACAPSCRTWPGSTPSSPPATRSARGCPVWCGCSSSAWTTRGCCCAPGTPPPVRGVRSPSSRSGSGSGRTRAPSGWTWRASTTGSP
ncbi:hypothetical protein GWI24_36415 [Streptomyces sp. MK37H]|nr:hypothetical protein [Streptomyces sp. MK37H]